MRSIASHFRSLAAKVSCVASTSVPLSAAGGRCGFVGRNHIINRAAKSMATISMT